MSVLLVTLLILFGLKYCNSQDFECCDGALRLAGGSVSNEGRVEICQSAEWKTVCDNNWSENEARVVCRQLGYTTQGAVPRIHASFGMGTGLIVEQIRCSGTESRLADCTIRDIADGECNHREDAGIGCPCRNGDIRLQGSTILGRGRVEVCMNNIWGTVCDNSWSSADANVVCNQLGFSRFGASSYCCARDGQGSGPIHMSSVGCRGNELSLTDCSHTTNHNCRHNEDASVQCQTRIVCHDGDVRLVGGRQPNEGRVEVCFNETWGTICDYIRPWSWNISQADVVCHQLGYSAADKSTYGFGRGSSRVLVKHVSCRGYESNIGECTYSTTGLSNCLSSGSDVIGVHCIPSTINNGEIRLTNGLHKYAGRVEMYWNSEWRTVCHDGWNERDAQVVCRELSYLSTSIQVLATSYKEYHFKTRNSVFPTDVGCNGSETNLTSCCASEISSNSYYCHSGAYAGVICGQCVENSTQLHGELAQTEGFVLICLGGFWGKIRRGSAAAAKVVCRQLGFSTEIKCQITGQTISGAPQGVQVSNITSSTISLTWSPPLVSERHGLTISGYVINCSAESRSNRVENAVHYTDSLSATLSNLHPFTTYNCCVAVNSDHGRGKLACQSTVTWDQAYPYNAVPTRVKSRFLNSSSLLLSWHFPDALYTNVIHVIEEYHIEVIDSRTGDQYIYTTEDTYLLIGSLKPNRQYTFSVAAFAGERGQFSLPHTVYTSIEPELDVQSTSVNPNQNLGALTLSLASVLGLVSFTLLIAIIIVSIYIGYRLCKSDKKATRPVEVPVYEMVDMSSSHPHANKPENHNMPNKPENVDIDLRILKQEQAKDFSHLPYEYLTSTFTKFDQRAGPGQVVATDKDNTYQPLIPPRFRALGDDKSEYQSLTLKTNTLPAKFNVSPMGSAPPAIPPKPKAM